MTYTESAQDVKFVNHMGDPLQHTGEPFHL